MARVVRELVNGNGLYFSRLAAGGPYAFLASPAVDQSGQIPRDAQVDSPYYLSPPAHVVAQTRYVFSRYVENLKAVASSIDQMLQVEQYIPRKVYADGYLDVSRGAEFMSRRRPASALLETGDIIPQGCVINPTGIALIPAQGMSKEIPPASPGYHTSLTKKTFGGIFVEEGPFNEIITAGPYVFTVGDVANDWQTMDIPEGVKVSDFLWWGNEARNETEFVLHRLEGYLKRAETSLENAVHCTLYVTDLGDLYEIDRVWKRFFPTAPPSRSVVPVRGLGVPRREGQGLGHADRAVKLEAIFQSIRPGLGAKKEVVATGTEPLAHESEAIKAGPLLWISQQFAGDRGGRRTSPSARSQLDYIFRRLEEICHAAGTTLTNLLRIRAFVTDVNDGYAVYAALKEAVPSDPPCVAVTGVPGPLQVRDCTLCVDAVAYVP